MAKLASLEGQGMHSEVLLGRTQQRFFDVSTKAEDRFTYPWAYEVDFNKRAEFDAASMDTHDINLKIRELMSHGNGTIVVKNRAPSTRLGSDY